MKNKKKKKKSKTNIWDAFCSMTADLSFCCGFAVVILAIGIAYTLIILAEGGCLG